MVHKERVCSAHTPGHTPCLAQGQGKSPAGHCPLSLCRCRAFATHLAQPGCRKQGGCCHSWPCLVASLCSDARAGLQLARGVRCRWIAQLWGSGKQLAASALVSKENRAGISFAPRGPGAAACPSTLLATAQVLDGHSPSALRRKTGKHEPATFCIHRATLGFHPGSALLCSQSPPHRSLGRRGDEHSHWRGRCMQGVYWED